ncbi:MAG: hypothetical protein Kow00121_60980 [Elainellaceae cyanobacterium]
MKKIIAAATLIALALGAIASEASAANGGFCRTSGQEAPVCQR